ncbi:MAG: hypothetical protein BTN85_0486 [Candidatus Methanohalarchaeum thermophilum]|uniref:Uncharacterized protein n=1 Tax=Methanohalarchaeum thermophilum TaxID=1903181 RepID=A0A1Q6DUJ1_METT1|nr:MAG: hypothetical protein BTN85_0486 [Candidatus Methanohalarchaeum thermophilum]
MAGLSLPLHQPSLPRKVDSKKITVTDQIPKNTSQRKLLNHPHTHPNTKKKENKWTEKNYPPNNTSSK